MKQNFRNFINQINKASSAKLTLSNEADINSLTYFKNEHTVNASLFQYQKFNFFKYMKRGINEYCSLQLSPNKRSTYKC